MHSQARESLLHHSVLPFSSHEHLIVVEQCKLANGHINIYNSWYMVTFCPLDTWLKLSLNANVVLRAFQNLSQTSLWTHLCLLSFSVHMHTHILLLLFSRWVVSDSLVPLVFLCSHAYTHIVVAVQSLSRVRLFVTLWTAAPQSSLSSTISWSWLRFMSIESVMLSNNFILCCPLLLPSIFPSITHLFQWVGSLR